MSLPFDAQRVREYAVELGAGGQRLGREFRLHDGSVLFVNDSQITPEIEQFISSLGSPIATSRTASLSQTLLRSAGPRIHVCARVPARPHERS
jgi:hypothetical protein